MYSFRNGGSLRQHLVGDAVLLGDVLSEAHAFRRSDLDLKGTLRTLVLHDEGRGFHLRIAFVEGIHIVGELVHVCVIDRADAFLQDGTHGVSGDVVAFFEGGGREGLVQEHEAVFGRFRIELLKADAFFTESSEIHGLVFVGREVGEDIVHRLILETGGRDVDAALGQDEEEADGLGDRGLTATVRTGQDVDGVVGIEVEVVIDDLFTVVRRDGELQVIKASSLHGEACVQIFLGEDGRLTEGHAFLEVALDELGEADVEQEFGDELGDVHDRNVHIFPEGVTEFLHEGVEELGDDLAEIECGALHTIALRHRRRRRMCICHVTHNDAAGGRLRIHLGQAVHETGAFFVRFGGGVVHVAVPVRALVEFVLGLQGVGEVADDTGFLKGSVVNGDEAEGTGLETLVDVDADGDALYATGFGLDLLDVRLHLGEEGIRVDGVDVFSQVQKALGFEVGASEAFLHGFDTFDIVGDLIELMEKIPKSHSLGGAALHGLKVLDVGDLVEKLHHLLPKVREIQDIDEDLLAVLGDTGVGGELREDAHDQDIFLRSLGEGGAQRVQCQVVAGEITELGIFGFVAIWEKNADGFTNVYCHVGPPKVYSVLFFYYNAKEGFLRG